MEEVHYGGEGPHWAVVPTKKKNLTGKKLLGKSRRMWKENIRINLKRMGVTIRNWIDSA